MIGEYAKFHGIALRSIIISAEAAIQIEKCEFPGRVDSFLLNGRYAIHIKHSAKRLPPWQFTFTADQITEINELKRRYLSVFFILVCGFDGLVTLSWSEFQGLVYVNDGSAPFIRIDRDRRSMYRVHGNRTKLKHAKINGVDEMVSFAFNDSVNEGPLS